MQNGNCKSGIASFVIINNEGWFVTAAHILKQWRGLKDAVDQVQHVEKRTEEIATDGTLSPKQRKAALRALGRVSRDAPDRASIWWARDGVRIARGTAYEDADLFVGKLEPWDAGWLNVFPVFKNPAVAMEPGASLCRLGFPLYEMVPTYDATGNAFRFPPGAVPIPFFPLEGMYVREIEVLLYDENGIQVAPTVPIKMIETSSPGLMGQSGGPIVDVLGRVWAIQSLTRHYPLGFNPPVPNGRGGQVEHQFLNAGWGVHAETVIGVLGRLGVRHSVSAD